MTDTNQPNDEGFAGDPATPEPEPARTADPVEGIAVPADDLTRPLAEVTIRGGMPGARLSWLNSALPP